MTDPELRSGVDHAALKQLAETPHATVFDGSDPRVVRLQLAAGDAIPEHDHPESVIVLYLVEGAVELTLDGDVHDLTAGDVVRFDGTRTVSPRAIEDSTALLVFVPRG